MRSLAFLGLFIAGLISLNSVAHAGWGSFFKNLTADSSNQLTEGTIADGLREALAVGVQKTVELTGKKGGYSDNAQIRIPLPSKFQKMDGMLRKLGLGAKLDEWQLSMNRAAEAAAPEAKALFLSSLKQMTLEDARRIYSGGDTAATEYFKEKTTPQLIKTYGPIVSEAMGRYDVTRFYQGFADKLPPGLGINTKALEDYVTSKALEGLFLTLGEQERAIRKDPAARVTAILKEVFSQPS